jgi:hypothetical protein
MTGSWRQLVLKSKPEHTSIQGWVMLQAPLTVRALLGSRVEQGCVDIFRILLESHTEYEVRHVLNRVTASVTAGV